VLFFLIEVTHNMSYKNHTNYKITIPVTIDFKGNDMSPQTHSLILSVVAASPDEALKLLQNAIWDLMHSEDGK